MRTTATVLILTALTAASLLLPVQAQAARQVPHGTRPFPTDLQPISETAIPRSVCTYFSFQRWNIFPPSPVNWLAGRDDVQYYTSATLGPYTIMIDDTFVDYDQFDKQHQALNLSLETQITSPGPTYTSNDFWLEITLSTNNPGYVDLLLHGTHTNTYYILQSRPDLNIGTPWTPIQQLSPPDVQEGQTPFGPQPANSPMMFYQAAHGLTTVAVATTTGDAIEPSPDGFFDGRVGQFAVHIVDSLIDATNLTVAYTLSGSASNGVDYVYLNGTVTITNNADALIDVQPLNDNTLDFDETVTVTIVATNGVVPAPFAASASLVIHDDPFVAVAQVDAPVAVDALTNSNWLLISANEGHNDADVVTNNFLRVDSTGFVTNWSGVRGQKEEVKIATVRITTNGFTAGEAFFSAEEPGTIGWVSADGTRWTNAWLTIPTETNHFRGSLYIDQTGIWSNALIAVAGEGFTLDPIASRSIWLINADKTFRLLTNIQAVSLEGILTLPNDPTKYGPWAGKLITGDEASDLIFAVNTDGTFTAFSGPDIAPPGGIAPSDFDLIPPNQDLYCTLEKPLETDHGLVLKIPRSFMTNYVGDILITRSGESTGQSPTGQLLFLHWDNIQSNFVVRSVAPPFGHVPLLEHSAFSPASIPSLLH